MGLLQDGCFVGDTDGEEQDDFFCFFDKFKGEGGRRALGESKGCCRLFVLQCHQSSGI